VQGGPGEIREGDQAVLDAGQAAPERGGHPGRVGLQQRSERRRDPLQAGPGVLGPAHPPGEAIHLQPHRAEDLAQTAQGHQAVEAHLPSSIPPVDEPLGEEEIRQRAGLDMGDPPFIEPDLHPILQAFEPEQTGTGHRRPPGLGSGKDGAVIMMRDLPERGRISSRSGTRMERMGDG